MIRPLLSALLILAVCYSAFAQNPSPTATQLRSDSLTLTVFPVTTQSPDSLKLQKGDSVFVFGGEQYFRARMGDKEFFISRQALLAHADSLVIPILQAWKHTTSYVNSGYDRGQSCTSTMFDDYQKRHPL